MEISKFRFRDVREMLSSDNQGVRMLGRGLPGEVREIEIHNFASGDGKFDVFYRDRRYTYQRIYDLPTDRYRLMTVSSFRKRNGEGVVLDLGLHPAVGWCRRETRGWTKTMAFHLFGPREIGAGMR